MFSISIVLTGLRFGGSLPNSPVNPELRMRVTYVTQQRCV